jgi:hypothetical protein
MPPKASPPAKGSTLSDYLKQISILTGSKNFYTWNEELVNLEYYADWPPELLDIAQNEEEDWDPADDESKLEKSQRRQAFSVLRLTMAAHLKHLRTGITPGDCRGFYKKIFNRFCRLTTGAISGLKKELAAFTMVYSGLSVEMYAADLIQKHETLLKVQSIPESASTDNELASLFLNGLLKPEFAAIVTYISMQSVGTINFSNVQKSVTDFAMDNNILELKRGKAAAIFQISTKVIPQAARKCRFGKKCNKGKKCTFMHDASDFDSSSSSLSSYSSGTSSSAEKGERKKSQHPRGTCFQCGSKQHYRDSCPEVASKKVKTGADGERVFMMSTHLISQPDSKLCFAESQNSIADGAATGHCMPFIRCFLQHTLRRVKIRILIGNGDASLYCYLVGQVHVQPLPLSLDSFILDEVMYVPQCPYFVISERIFDDKGCAITKFNGKISFTLRDDPGEMQTIIKGQKQCDDLYHLNLTTSCVTNDSEISSLVNYCPDPSTVFTTERLNFCTFDKNSARPQDCPIIDVASVSKSASKVNSDSETKPCPIAKDAVLMSLTAAEVFNEHRARMHTSFARIRRLFNQPTIQPHHELNCDSCKIARPKTKHKKRGRRGKKRKLAVPVVPLEALDEVQIDIGHFSFATWALEFYFQMVVDVGTRKIWVPLMRFKDESFPSFEFIHRRWRVTKPHRHLKKLTGGGEYYTKDFIAHSKLHGYLLNVLSPYTEKAWIAERMIGILRDMIMPTIHTAKTSFKYWGDCSRYAAFIINEDTTEALPDTMTRNQAWELEVIDPDWKQTEKMVFQRQFNVWGSLAFVKTFINSKACWHSELALYLGETEDTKGRSIVELIDSGRRLCSKNVSIQNHRFPCIEMPDATVRCRVEAIDETPSDHPGSAESLMNAWKNRPVISSDTLTVNQVHQINENLGLDVNVQEPAVVPERDMSRVREPSGQAIRNAADGDSMMLIKFNTSDSIYPISKPTSEDEAMNGPQKKQWKGAKVEEMTEVRTQKVYKLVPRSSVPKGIRIIPSRFDYKIKWKFVRDSLKGKISAYEIERFKARWIAQGFNMKKGRDFKESYSLNLAYESDLIMLAIAAYYGFHVGSIDFKNFYLQGVLKDSGESPFYVEQAPGFEVGEDMVCEINKGLYGLPPSGRVVQERLCHTMTKKLEFTRGLSERMHFSKWRQTEPESKQNSFTHIGYFVDDGKVTTNDLVETNQCVKDLNEAGFTCELKLKPKKFLGLQYDYRDDGAMIVHQEAHITKLAFKMGLSNSTNVPTPMDSNGKRGKDDDVFETEDIRKFQSFAGDFIWASKTQYYCAFAIHSICTAMSKPTSFDYKLTKRCCRFLSANPHRGLIFHPCKSIDEPLLTYAYVDMSWPSESLYCITAVAVFMGRPDLVNHINLSAAVMVNVKKETLAIGSTMDGELLALSKGELALEHVNGVREEAGFPQLTASIIFTDSKPSISFLKATGAVNKFQSRHLRKRMGRMFQALELNRVQLEYVKSELNCVDSLTKALGPQAHARHTPNLMGHMNDA